MKQKFLILRDCIIRISTITAVTKQDEDSGYCIYIHYGFADDYYYYNFKTESQRDSEYHWICKRIEESEASD